MTVLGAGFGLPERTIVTGGSSGIGLATARLLVEAGGRVGLIGRDPARLAAARDEIAAASPEAVCAATADVADEGALGTAIGGLVEHLGGLDALVCAAGTDGEMGASIEEATAGSFRDVLETNVVGVFAAVQAALPALARAESGTVTIVGSDSGFVAAPGMIAYNASKGALVQLTRALSLECFERHGVRVNSVCPSIVDTPMARRGLGVESFAGSPFPVQTADDVAWAIAFLASRRSRAVNGVSLLSDFGYAARSSFPA